MQVKEFMTGRPASCTPETSLREVAWLMEQHDCGAIPVVESQRPIGVVTDRDITCRAVAEGKNPLEMKARDVMSSPCVTVAAEASLEDCCHTLEVHQIRRIVVVDDHGSCCGIVAQADIALEAPAHEAVEVLREVSFPVLHER